MREATKEAMRRFGTGMGYTTENLEKDYRFELANYSDERWKHHNALRACRRR